MLHKNSMATAALALGIFAVFSGSMPLTAVPLGALAVLCAILSKTDRHLPGKSIAGMIAGIIAAVGSCAITAQTFYSIQNNPQMRAYYAQILDSLLEEYGLADGYNPFRDAPSDNPSSGTDDDSETPAPEEAPQQTPDPAVPSPGEDGRSSDDYFDSLYDDYFRYFYGADPYHDTPEPSAPTPAQPSGNSLGGEYI